MGLNPCIRDWHDRRVWVIGASSGIGAALARVLLAQGARVALSARSTPSLAKIAATPGANTLVLPLDVTDAASVAPALQQVVAAWGGIDLVLWCAGSHSPVRAWELDAADARRLVDVNLNGVINGLPAVVGQLLLQKSGGIAIVSSVAGYGGLPTALVYGATKAALINLAETLYLDLAPRGIAVYLINPGFVKTPLTDKNTFKMPALISAEEAAREIIAGFSRGNFEIHFPRRFTLWLKLLRLLPYRWYFALVHKGTGM
ncbi:MAG: SDR family NAD(P)-dependent oxidoreductase [Burkholderiales bacterium]|jgi:NADP-dependent 3-hydroxy acid dehydrogenase YdfG|nr:SDR family NAD(P)-dependent oxidoreductase [Burkholderiales bacterium]